MFAKDTQRKFSQAIVHSGAFRADGALIVDSLDSKGNIYSCIRFVGYSLRNKAPRMIGTLNTGIDYNKLRPLLSFDRDSCYPQECINCEMGAFCRWCPAENYDSSDTGTIFQRTTTICQLHKANVRSKNYFWNKINIIETYGRSQT